MNSRAAHPVLRKWHLSLVSSSSWFYRSETEEERGHITDQDSELGPECCSLDLRPGNTFIDTPPSPICINGLCFLGQPKLRAQVCSSLP